MNWLILIVAGIFECVWAISLKLSNGFTDLKWSITTVVFLALSMLMLGYSLKSIPVGTAYAVWTGIGAVGTAILGMIFFDESKDVIRILCILLIFAGIAGLKIFGK